MEGSGSENTWYNEDKLDEAVMALLWLAARRCDKDKPCRIGPGIDREVLRRLEARGLVTCPGDASSAVLTDEGRRRSERLFRKLFGSPCPATLPRQPAGHQVEELDGE